MSKYELYLAIHLLAIVTWLGGGLTANLALSRILGTGDIHTFGTATENIGFIAQRLYTSASLVALITGLLLTHELHVNVYEPWVLIAIVVLVASAVVGATYLGPRAEGVGELIAGGASYEQVKAQFDKFIAINRVEMVFLFLIVIDMAVKPGWP
jgi:uncharacterized membrane protein